MDGHRLHVYNTLFFQAHQQGGTVARPLFFEFTQDSAAWAVDGQFMLGGALLITPCLEDGVTQVTGYFPPTTDWGDPAVWYDFWTLKAMQPRGWVQLPAPLDFIKVHIAGGNVLPLQQPALTLQAQRDNA